LIKPEYKYERYGCEDPRISKLGDTYYILYTSLSRPAYGKKEGVRIALATTKDFKKIKKQGIIGPDIKSKAAVLFPKKLGKKIGMMLTLYPDTPMSSIVYASFDNMNGLLNSKKYWQEHSIKNSTILSNHNLFKGPEIGASPLITKKGWLLIYCGASKKGGWSISALLLDLKNPKKVISNSIQILTPEKEYELKGLVPNVTFPSGAVIFKNLLFVYYGAADKTCCLATCNLSRLLKTLT
jgi:beta-1,2-mannobiose phosphorylase / 1,2-beta-oligomannan phosphorylase